MEKIPTIISSLHPPRYRHLIFGIFFSLLICLLIIIIGSFVIGVLGIVAVGLGKAHLNFSLCSTSCVIILGELFFILVWFFILYLIFWRMKTGVFSISDQGISFYLRKKISLHDFIFTPFEDIDYYYVEKDSIEVHGTKYPGIFFYLKNGKEMHSGPITESELKEIEKILNKMGINEK